MPSPRESVLRRRSEGVISVSQRNRLNLLFIFTDEQAAATMAAYGNTMIHTPNLNRLAERSLVFANAYVTQPVCTPSRSSLLTGLYPHSSGCTENNIPLNTDVPCLPELVCPSDYVTGYIGKWHLGDELFAQHGFQVWQIVEDMYRQYCSPGRDRFKHSPYHDFLVGNGLAPDARSADGFGFFSRLYCAALPEELGKAAYVAAEACRFLRENRDHPFLLYVNFLEPHMPYTSPRDSQYDPGKVRLPDNFHSECGADRPLKTRLFARAYRELGRDGFPLSTESDWRRFVANYWGMASLVDTHLGFILDTLEECGLAEKTILVFTSDHGDMMGSHRLLAKCVMFQEAIRVPLITRIPGLTGRGRIEPPVSQIDLVPTLIEALGREVPDGLDGHSWIPFLKGESPLAQKDVFIEWNGFNSGFGDIVGGSPILPCWEEIADEEEILRALGDPVRTVITPDGWKYNHSSIGEHELYDLGRDPLETRNLAQDPGYREFMGELRRRIAGWQSRTTRPLGSAVGALSWLNRRFSSTG